MSDLYRWDESEVDETLRGLAYELLRDLVNSGGLVKVEPVLTREDAATEMVGFFNAYCDDAPYWPERSDALKWLEVDDE